MPERNPAAFAIVGSGPIRVLACVSELVEIRIVRCLAGEKSKKQWRERNPDYFIAHRILDRGNADRAPESLRLPRPLSQLPWDIAQFEFGVKGTDFIGVLSTVSTARWGFQSGFPKIDSLLDEYTAERSVSGFMTRDCFFDPGFAQ
ncbi:MAG TPA: hypothetical protein VF207_06880, partial [Chthoniobacterales bacterium]